jgi:hypothetical protein
MNSAVNILINLWKLLDRQSFIQKFVESQLRDLAVILGNERAAEGGRAGRNASFEGSED